MVKFPLYEAFLSQESFAFPIIVTFRADAVAAVVPHHHQFYELSFYTAGEVRDCVNGQWHHSSRGTVVSKPPQSIHETRLIDARPFTKYNLMFDMDLLFRQEPELRSFYYPASGGRPLFLQLTESQTAHLERLFDDIHRNYEAEQVFRQSYIRAKLVEIFVVIARYQTDRAVKSRSERKHAAADRLDVPSPETTTTTPNAKIAQVLQYINSQFLTELSLGGLAQQFGVSVPYLSKMLKKTTGTNFTEYVHTLRIEQACSLLLSTRMSMLEIAEEVGFSSFKTFSRVFKTKKGITPSKYRAIGVQH